MFDINATLSGLAPQVGNGINASQAHFEYLNQLKNNGRADIFGGVNPFLAENKNLLTAYTQGHQPVAATPAPSPQPAPQPTPQPAVATNLPPQPAPPLMGPDKEGGFYNHLAQPPRVMRPPATTDWQLPTPGADGFVDINAGYIPGLEFGSPEWGENMARLRKIEDFNAGVAAQGPGADGRWKIPPGMAFAGDMTTDPKTGEQISRSEEYARYGPQQPRGMGRSPDEIARMREQKWAIAQQQPESMANQLGGALAGQSQPQQSAPGAAIKQTYPSYQPQGGWQRYFGSNNSGGNFSPSGGGK